MTNRKKFLEECCENYAAQNKELIEKCKRLEFENRVLRNFVNGLGKKVTDEEEIKK